MVHKLEIRHVGLYVWLGWLCVHRLQIRHVGLCIWLGWLYGAQVINQACGIVCLVRLAVWGHRLQIRHVGLCVWLGWLYGGTSYKSGMWECVFG